MNIIAIIQARMGSTRFPGKVLADLCGKPILQHVVERVNRSRVSQVVVAYPEEGADDLELCGVCLDQGICIPGDPEDVAHRFQEVLLWAPECLTRAPINAFVRINADCPLIEPARIDELITLYESTPGVAYCGFRRASDKVPAILTHQGLPELVDVNAFREHMQNVREHVTWGMYEDPRRTAWIDHPCDEHNTIDTPQDLQRMRVRLETAGVYGEAAKSWDEWAVKHAT